MSLLQPRFSQDLSGQVALITGASSGLGARFAHVLAAAGARVALAARRADRLQERLAQITAAGGEGVAIALDVADREQLAPAVERVERALGTISILINNAGAPDAHYATKMPTPLIDGIIATKIGRAHV